MKSMKFWLKMFSLGVLVSASLILANPMMPELYGHHQPWHGGGGSGGTSCSPGGGGFSYNYRCIGQELVNFLSLEAPRDVFCSLSVEIDIDRISDPVITQVTNCDNELRFVSNSDLDLTITKIDETVPQTPQSQAVLDALGLFVDRSESDCDFYNPAGRRINRNPQVSLDKVLRDSPGNDLWFDPRGPLTQTLLLMNKPGRAGVFDCSFQLDFFLDPNQVMAIAAGEYDFRMNFLSSTDSDSGCDEDFDDPEAICETGNESNPDANDDFASTTVNSPAMMVDVLENDFDIFDQDDLYIIEAPQMLNPEAGSVICDLDVPKSSGGQCYFTPAFGYQGSAYFNYTIADRPSSNPLGKSDRATATVAVGNNIDLYFWDGTVDGNVTNDPTFIDDDHFEAYIDGVPVGNGVGTNATPLKIGLSLDPGWHTVNFCFVEERPFEGQLGVLSYEVRDKITGSKLKSGYGLSTVTVDNEDDFPVCFDEFSSSFPRSFYVPDHN